MAKMGDPPIHDLQWRLMGPHRGGRVTAVAGDPDHLLTFYFGAAAGGVFKTDDAGITWRNVSDGFFRTASVGALAVAAADPAVVYVGMGEACIRGNVSYGDGVWRSDDGGSTWRHLGLADTRHIGRIRVHPRDPDVAYVAALGHAFGPHPARGVFRTTDGGSHWEQVLYRNADTGAIDLSLDPHNPRILYAALWDARRYPWALRSGGPGSGLMKSLDGGREWIDLTTRPGLPGGVWGRVGVACSPARPERVWALIEAEAGGLYRSDNAGATWQRVSDAPDLRQRPWYYMHLFADPVDADTVYVLNLGMWVSRDGGRHFEEMTNPYGDNHDLWIDPRRPERMILGNDGGATVTLNGGKTWSTLHNQPTAQFYHVTTDRQFPYRVYGAQQDNTTLSVPSYSDAGTITIGDCYPVGGGESGYIAVRPDHPNIVYAGSYASRMTRYDHVSRQQIDITVWPEDPIGYGAGDLRYRFQWTFPIALSPHNPDVLYAAGNVVFRSLDGGQSWTAISPDLTRADPATLQSSGGPITQDNVSTEYYGTVFALAESPVAAGVIWAGSDDGLIHLSRDHGAHWDNVTPPDLPPWTLISVVEPSPHDAATAYVAATRYKLDDPEPYLYRTTDWGRSWTRIVDGIEAGDYTRVIREDPVRRDMLYAGTETGIYVSWDAGRQWRRLGGNLPVVPIHDLVVHRDAAADDLVVATHGRSFWILDDVTPLRAWPEAERQAVYLASPRPAYRRPPTWQPPAEPGQRIYLPATVGEAIAEVRETAAGRKETVLLTAGANPPAGVLVQYRLAQPAARLVLTFLTEAGHVIRTFASDAADPADRPPNGPGLNRYVWDMRWPSGVKLEGVALSPYWGGSEVGPVAVPGTYRIRLEADGYTEEAAFEIRLDPRVRATPEDMEAQFQLLLAIRDKISAVHTAVLRGRRVRARLDAWREAAGAAGEAAVGEALGDLAERIRRAEDALVESRGTSRADSFNYPPKVNSKLASLQATVAYGDGRPPSQCEAVFRHLAAEADQHLAALNQLLEDGVGEVNDRLREAGLAAVVTL